MQVDRAMWHTLAHTTRLSSDIFFQVPLHNWLLVFTRRDQGKAGDFLQTMKRVCPPMGIEVST